ncbi:unnamed protein product [Schistosoma turkestanicum]|nr:unnamed protein product [Schistosoma turkestanicum]
MNGVSKKNYKGNHKGETKFGKCLSCGKLHSRNSCAYHDAKCFRCATVHFASSSTKACNLDSNNLADPNDHLSLSTISKGNAHIQKRLHTSLGSFHDFIVDIGSIESIISFKNLKLLDPNAVVRPTEVSILGETGLSILGLKNLKRLKVELSFLVSKENSDALLEDLIATCAKCNGGMKTVQHRSAKQIQNVDYISRQSLQDKPVNTSDCLLVQPLPVKRPDLIRETRRNFGCIINAIRKGWNANLKRRFPIYFSKRDELSTTPDGILCLNDRVVIPPSLRKAVLEDLHSGHLVVEKMKSLAKLTCWWPEIKADICRTANNCVMCHKLKNQHLKWTPWPVSSEAWQRIHADYCGPFLGKYYALVVIDSFSKWPEVFFTTSPNSDITIQALRKVFSREGVPMVCPDEKQSQGQSKLCSFNSGSYSRVNMNGVSKKNYKGNHKGETKFGKCLSCGKLHSRNSCAYHDAKCFRCATVHFASSSTKACNLDSNNLADPNDHLSLSTISKGNAHIQKRLHTSLGSFHDFIVDIGSIESIISFKNLKSLDPNVVIRPTEVSILGITGRRLPIRGCCELLMRDDNSSYIPC